MNSFHAILSSRSLAQDDPPSRVGTRGSRTRAPPRLRLSPVPRYPQRATSTIFFFLPHLISPLRHQLCLFIRIPSRNLQHPPPRPFHPTHQHLLASALSSVQLTNNPCLSGPPLRIRLLVPYLLPLLLLLHCPPLLLLRSWLSCCRYFHPFRLPAPLPMPKSQKAGSTTLRSLDVPHLSPA